MNQFFGAVVLILVGATMFQLTEKENNGLLRGIGLVGVVAGVSWLILLRKRTKRNIPVVVDEHAHEVGTLVNKNGVLVISDDAQFKKCLRVALSPANLPIRIFLRANSNGARCISSVVMGSDQDCVMADVETLVVDSGFIYILAADRVEDTTFIRTFQASVDDSWKHRREEEPFYCLLKNDDSTVGIVVAPSLGDDAYPLQVFKRLDGNVGLRLVILDKEHDAY